MEHPRGPWPEPLSNRRVDFSFMDARIGLMLSLGLFSSHDVDGGTRLLLKALAHSLAASAQKPARVLDIGCGTGVIGIALAAALPGSSVTAMDRDALALDFTRANAAANGLSARLRARGGLLLDLEPGERFDLIISNIPAKAGPPALKDFFSRAPAFLAPGGKVWVVIVNSLWRQARDSILDAGHELSLEEEGKEHCVLAFCQASAPHAKDVDPSALAADDSSRLEPYDRGGFDFNVCGMEYRIRAVHGLEDFSEISYGLALEAKVITKLGPEGLLPGGAKAGGLMDAGDMKDARVIKDARVLVWAPGHGHLPLILSRLLPGALIHLAGRDLLELLAAERSLRDNGAPPPASLSHCGSPLALPDSLGTSSIDLALFHPDLVSGADWTEEVIPAARALLSEGGMLLIQAESSALACLDKKRPAGFRALSDKREKGRRAMWYIKV